YRAAALRLRRHGDFWLSDTPERVGSVSPEWGNRLPRMATWGEFEHLETGRTFTFLNTHLDHASSLARENAARQIVRFLCRPDLAPPAILAGDLNADPDSLTLQLLTGRAPVDGAASRLRDATAGSPAMGAPTFHDFTGRGTERIDYVLVEPAFRVERYQVLDE